MLFTIDGVPIQKRLSHRILFLLGRAVDPAGAREQLLDWRTNVTLVRCYVDCSLMAVVEPTPDFAYVFLSCWQTFTWLYMGSKAVFFFFLIYVVVRFGNVKLGTKDEPPEFSTPAYFAMIFAAGVAVGLFVYGVAEPLYYLDSNWFANPGYRSEDEIAMFAINLTITNWGVNGWAPYLVVAVCMALAGTSQFVFVSWERKPVVFSPHVVLLQVSDSNCR